VLEAAEPGAHVKKDEVVLRLDPTKIDDAIRDAETGLALSATGLKLGEEELAAMEKLVPLDLDAAERAKQIADEDLKRYTEIDRPSSVKQANFNVKNHENGLLYQQEELRQLEKMYKADDMVEETEEIVLKRQRDVVERVAFALELAKIATDKTLNVDLPRQDVAVNEAATRQAIALVKAKASLPTALAKKRLEVEKMKADQAKAAEKLAKLKGDRELMVAKAPSDGIVYYGPCVRGAWPKLGQNLDRGSNLKPHDVVMTIVEPRPLVVRAIVPEDQIDRMRTGLEGTVTPTGYAGLSLKAKVESVSEVPVTVGNFEAKLAVTLTTDAAPLMPGMNCSATLVSLSKKDALVVPASAVLADGEASYVNVQKGDGHEKRPVKVGVKLGGKAEILEGLKAGDVVLLERPEGE